MVSTMPAQTPGIMLIGYHGDQVEGISQRGLQIQIATSGGVRRSVVLDDATRPDSGQSKAIFGNHDEADRFADPLPMLNEVPKVRSTH